MSLWISWLFGSFIYDIGYCYICNKLLYGKCSINKKNYILLLPIIILQSLIVILFDQTIRMIFILFTSFSILRFIYNEKRSKSITITCLIYCLLAISEVICAILMFYILKFDSSLILTTFYGICLTNFFIVLLISLFIKINFVRNIINRIVEWYSEKTKLILILIIIYFLLVLFALFPFVSNGLNNNKIFFLCSIFIITLSVFAIFSFKQNADKNKIFDEYDNLMKYVDNYGKIVDQKCKDTHEYKNQLIILKDLMVKTNTKALDYIDNLLSTKLSNSKCIQVKCIGSIPIKGIKGLFYYKVDEMVEKGIEVYVSVNIVTKQGKLWKTCEKNLQDVSRVLGVYIDNAIQACVLSDKKFIVLDVVEEKDSLIFSISNTFKDVIDINKVDKEGYTTKGHGHGYGLSLAKDILDKNKYLTQEKEINGIYYVQKLIIKNEK